MRTSWEGEYGSQGREGTRHIDSSSPGVGKTMGRLEGSTERTRGKRSLVYERRKEGKQRTSG